MAVELLHKLLNDEIQHRTRSELVRSRTFSLMLEEAIRCYTNRAIQAAEVIEQLIQRPRTSVSHASAANSSA